MKDVCENVHLTFDCPLQLFSSKRRVRIFLMDAEEEEDEEDEEDITHGEGEIDKSQTESQSEPRAEDSQVMEEVGGDEDKENTLFQ